MKIKTLRIFYLTAFAFLLFLSCDRQLNNEMSKDYPENFQVNYKLRKVLQYDPMNINGVDISKELDFFETLKLTLNYNKGKLTTLSFDNGDIPFSPFNFESEQKFEVPCEIDYDVSPNELRIKDTNKVIAYFINSNFIMPFVLDCELLSYRYTFTTE